MNGIHVKKPNKGYYTCDICNAESKVVEIEADVSCHEYGYCGDTIWLCIACLTKIANGETEIKHSRLKV